MTFNIELLDHYTSTEIMGVFLNLNYTGVGTIPMRVVDDVIVNSATLRLSDTPLSLPSTLALLGLGLVRIGLRRRRLVAGA